MRLQFKYWTMTDGVLMERRASRGPLVYKVYGPSDRCSAWVSACGACVIFGPVRRTPAEAEADCEVHLQLIADALDAERTQQ